MLIWFIFIIFVKKSMNRIIGLCVNSGRIMGLTLIPQEFDQH